MQQKDRNKKTSSEIQMDHLDNGKGDDTNDEKREEISNESNWQRLCHNLSRRPKIVGLAFAGVIVIVSAAICVGIHFTSQTPGKFKLLLNKMFFHLSVKR
jgi:hypothetical protein